MSSSTWRGIVKAKNDIKGSFMSDDKRKNVSKIEAYWQRQQKFFQATTKALDNFVDVISNEVKYLSTHTDFSGMKTNDSMIIQDTLQLVGNIFMTASKDLKTIENVTFKYVLKEINSVKSHLSDENEEIVVKNYHHLVKMISWNAPIMFNNFLHPFITIFDSGSVFFNENDAMNTVISKAQEVKQAYIIQNSQPSALYCNKSIPSILASEQRTPSQLPIAVESIYNYLYDKGYTTPGIFREITTGNKQQVDGLYLRMAITSFEDLQPDIVAAILKKFLRNLPTHIFDKDQTRSLLMNYDEHDLNGIKITVGELIPEHSTILKYVLKLACKISAYADVNFMVAKNLSVCLTPSLLSFEDTDTFTVSRGIEIIEAAINGFPELFPNDVDTLVFRKTRVLKRKTTLLKSDDSSDVLSLIQKQTKTKPLPKPINTQKQIQKQQTTKPIIQKTSTQQPTQKIPTQQPTQKHSKTKPLPSHTNAALKQHQIHPDLSTKIQALPSREISHKHDRPRNVPIHREQQMNQSNEKLTVQQRVDKFQSDNALI
ncbi:Rho-GAP domain-containing protein [Entamoeba marina]